MPTLRQETDERVAEHRTKLERRLAELESQANDAAIDLVTMNAGLRSFTSRHRSDCEYTLSKVEPEIVSLRRQLAVLDIAHERQRALDDVLEGVHQDAEEAAARVEREAAQARADADARDEIDRKRRNYERAIRIATEHDGTPHAADVSVGITHALREATTSDVLEADRRAEASRLLDVIERARRARVASLAATMENRQ